MNEIEDDFDWSKPYQVIKKEYMNYKPLLSALVSGVGMALLGYLSSVTDFWVLNWHQVVSIALGAAVISLIKYFGTTPAGNFVGVVPVAPPKLSV